MIVVKMFSRFNTDNLKIPLSLYVQLAYYY